MLPLILILFSNQIASARMSPLQSFLFEFGFISDSSVQICPEDPKLDFNIPEEVLWNRAEQASLGYNKCEAAALYKNLIVSYPGGKHSLEGYRSYIKSYLAAQDFIMAINAANTYLDDAGGRMDSEYIHLLLLRAVQGQINLSWKEKERQFEFVALSLGL